MSAARKKCIIKKVQQAESCNMMKDEKMKRVQDEKSATRKKCNPKKVHTKIVQHEKTATCEECKTENDNIETSATWK